MIIPNKYCGVNASAGLLYTQQVILLRKKYLNFGDFITLFAEMDRKSDFDNKKSDFISTSSVVVKSAHRLV